MKYGSRIALIGFLYNNTYLIGRNEQGEYRNQAEIPRAEPYHQAILHEFPANVVIIPVVGNNMMMFEYKPFWPSGLWATSQGGERSKYTTAHTTRLHRGFLAIHFVKGKWFGTRVIPLAAVASYCFQTTEYY
jgi:hypothetical protein